MTIVVVKEPLTGEGVAPFWLASPFNEDGSPRSLTLPGPGTTTYKTLQEALVVAEAMISAAVGQVCIIGYANLSIFPVPVTSVDVPIPVFYLWSYEK